MEKYKDDYCFIVEIDYTCMEAWNLDKFTFNIWVMKLEEYARTIINSNRDEECPSWGTYEEK